MRRAGGFSALLVLIVVVSVFGWFSQTDDARLFALSVPSGHLRWSAELPTGTRFVGNPTPGFGRVLVSTAGQGAFGGSQEHWNLAAFDAQSGHLLWQYQPPADRSRRIEAARLGLTSPHVSDRRVYMRVETSDTSTLLALDAATGREAWTADRLAFGHDSRHTDVVTASGLVLAPLRDDGGLTLRALQEENGAERWRVALGNLDYPRDVLGPYLAATPNTFYVGLSSGVLALDAASGEERFRLSTPDAGSGGGLALDAGLLFWRSSPQTIQAFDLTSGELRWTYQQPFGERTGSLRAFDVRNGLLAVYCACDTANDRRSSWLLGIDSAAGVERWRAPLDAYIDLYQDVPAVGAGVVLAGVEGDDVSAYSAVDGSPIWRFPRARGQFVSVSGSFIYASDRDVRWRHWLARLGFDPEG